jgi:hypothetical protein
MAAELPFLREVAILELVYWSNQDEGAICR